MRFGAIYGSGFGSPANMLGQPTDARRVRAGTAVEVRLAPATGFGDAWYGIYVGSRLAGMIYAAEGTTTTRQAFPCASDTREALILRHGHQSQYDMSRIARRHYAATVAARATLSWTWPAQVIGVIAADGSENSDLSSWNVSGMLWSALEPGASDTRRKLSVDVSTSLGVTTITLKRYGVPVASGAVSAPGIAALAEQNSSGISGAVTVGAAPADTTGATLHIRFPQSLRVLRDQVDPPTTIQAIVDFNKSDQGIWTEPVDLSAGTYYYRTEYISDTGDEGAETATETIVIPGPPEPPSSLAYSSGAAAATVLSFVASPTSGATYRAYLMQPGGASINFGAPAATAPVGSTTITLPALTGYPGTAYVVVRAVSSGGAEEVNGEVLALEYDALGSYVVQRPNTPTVTLWDVTAGNTLQVTAGYDPTDEAGIATQIHLCTRTPSGSYTWTAPDATAALVASAVHPGAKTASLQILGAVNGWHYFALKSATAAGMQSASASAEILVYIDTTDLAAPSVDTDISRG